MSEHKIPIPGRIYNASGGNVCGTDDIIDDVKGKKQSQINTEVDERTSTLEQNVGPGGSVDERINNAKSSIIGDAGSDYNTLGKTEDKIQEETANRLNEHYLKTETYNKNELNNLITTPSQEYVTVVATDQTTAATDVLPATGSADTIYRVGNWDGTQYDESLYTEYAWNGSAYVRVGVKSQVGEVYDISLNHAGATYIDLSDALGTNGGNIPVSLRKGGMSVKFVQSSDNKYVQFRCIADEFTTDVTKWQGVDSKPTLNSHNLIESGGVAEIFKESLFNSGYLDDNGKITGIGNERYSYSNLIIASVGLTILGVYPRQTGNRPCLWFYDEYGTLVGTYNAPSTSVQDITLTSEMIPSGAKYVQFYVYNESFRGMYNFMQNESSQPYNMLKHKLGYIVSSAKISYTATGLKFESGDFYAISQNGERKQILFQPPLELEINNWSVVVYNLSSNSISVKTSAQIIPSDIVLASFDANKNMFKSSFLFLLMSNAIEDSVVLFTRKVEYNFDSIYIQKGSIYIKFPNNTYFAHYMSNGITFDLQNKYIVLNLVTNAIEAISNVPAISRYHVPLLNIIDGKVTGGMMSDFVVSNTIRFDIGYLDWSNGQYVANTKRLYSHKFRFDHDVYVGFSNPIFKYSTWNTLQYRIYLYNQDNTYQGVYIESNGYHANKSSYNIANTFIPKNTTFAIVLKYTNENVEPDYPLEYIMTHDVFAISANPLYYQIPNYYLNGTPNAAGARVNYLDGIIENIHALYRRCANNGDLFVNITDVHFERNQQHSPALIKYISEKINIERMFNCGDDYDGGEVDVYKIYKDALPNGDYLWVTGNHDVDNNSPLSTYNDLAITHYPSINDKIHYGSYKYGYYYVDNEDKKIRYIVLNSIGDSAASIPPYDTEQMSWLTNTALNVESGWSILIYTHIIFGYGGSDGVLNIPSYVTSNLVPVLNSYSGNGQILAIFCGDQHDDRIYKISNKNIPVIMTRTDGYHREFPSEKPRMSVYEQAFDVTVVNKEEKTINLVRVGALAHDGYALDDRGYSVNIRTVYSSPINVGDSIELYSPLNISQWASDKDNIVSVSNGVCQAIASGTALITGTTDRGEKQSYLISVN